MSDAGWNVILGDQTFTTSAFSEPTQTFSGWKTASFTFTWDGVGNLLSFSSYGSGLPPFVLLDAVSINAVPEPSTLPFMARVLIGLAVVHRV